MKTMHFSTVIQAGRPTVWHAMLGPDSYRRWTAPFAEGSYYEGSWDQGATIRFLAPDGGGMMAKTWPKALQELRTLCESPSARQVSSPG